MKSRVIANPPLGIYENSKTHIGHASFLVLLDTVARYKRQFVGERVYFPGRSYNLYGKRGDALLDEGVNSSMIGDEHRRTIERDDARKKLNLSSLDLLTDDEPAIATGVQNDFRTLHDKGYIRNSGNTFYLDCSKIAKDHDLSAALSTISFHPSRVKVEMQRLIARNAVPVEITRPTRYSVSNPLGGNNIGPLYTLANLWDHKYGDCNFTIAGSNSVLAKYVFLRFMSSMALRGSPGMDELIIWPKVRGEGGIPEWNLDVLIGDRYDGDMVRHALMSSYTEKDQATLMQKSRLHAGRKFVHLLANLRRPLKGVYPADVVAPPRLVKHLENFDFPLLLNEAEQELRCLSSEINARKNIDSWENVRVDLASRYMALVKVLEPIVPATVDLIQKEIHNG